MEYESYKVRKRLTVDSHFTHKYFRALLIFLQIDCNKVGSNIVCSNSLEDRFRIEKSNSQMEMVAYFVKELTISEAFTSDSYNSMGFSGM
jgi:hypothetical protein